MKPARQWIERSATFPLYINGVCGIDVCQVSKQRRQGSVNWDARLVGAGYRAPITHGASRMRGLMIACRQAGYAVLHDSRCNADQLALIHGRVSAGEP
jgi:hypothetical protein